MDIPAIADRTRLTCDVLVIGGGTAGTMAALTAAEAGADVLLLDKSHVRHSGALAMGMDGVNNAVIPGKAEPEDYVAEITRANDGIVDQRTVYQTATRGFAMIQRLEGYGVKFEKDEYGEYAVRRVHRSGSYVLPMPEGKDVKKALYRVLRQKKMRERIRVENRVMPVRVLTTGSGADTRAVGAVAFNTRTGEFVEISAGAVVLATGPCGRLGLPASGYLYGTYENPANAGDGYAMAYHAGAELSGIECFQINPLIKDYNGPACAYVANPFGGYQVNSRGERFVDSDYWSGQMIKEVRAEIDSARGPIYLKVSHLPEETLTELESILHTTERPTRGTFHANRGHDYRTHDIEMHVSEIGLCGGHSASGVWVDENARTTVPGLYAAGDLACVPHNYMIGAFVFGELAGADAVRFAQRSSPASGDLGPQIAAAHELIYGPGRRPDGPPQPQVEYKLRRFVNDYIAPPKTAPKLTIAIETFERMRGEVDGLGARTPHELMRCVEVSFIRDCAEMAAKASLARTESRWGLYHDRPDLPARDDERWGRHLNLRLGTDGEMEFLTRPVAPYLVAVDEFDHIPGTSSEVEVLGPLAVAPIGAIPAAPDRSADVAAVSPRLRELLALDGPSSAELSRFLSDPDTTVRRSAVTFLVEGAPDDFLAPLVAALGDPDAGVRRTAAAGLIELVEVLPSADGLAAFLESADPVVRAAVGNLLRSLKAGTAAQFSALLGDDDHRVRVVGVSGLVSHDDWAALAPATLDANREVRIAAAAGLATVGRGGVDAVRALAADHDPLVRAAAFEALGVLGDATDVELLGGGLADRAWQVRQGAARGTVALGPDGAVAALVAALTDPHLDVRKAAVVTLRTWPTAPSVSAALTAVLDDADADVRAHARLALATG